MSFIASMQVWLNIGKLSTIIYHINGIKRKILINTKEARNRFQRLFMIRTLSKLATARNVLSLMKSLWKNKTIARTTVPGEVLSTFPVSLGTKTCYPFWCLLFNIVLRVLVTSLKQKIKKGNRQNKIHTNQIGKSKIVLFAYGMIVYLKILKIYDKN